MLQMHFGQGPVARPPDAAAPDALRHSALDSGALRVESRERGGSLPLPRRAQRGMLLLRAQRELPGPGGGARALRADGAGAAIRLRKLDLVKGAPVFGRPVAPGPARLAARTGHGVRLPVDRETGHAKAPIGGGLPRSE